MYKHCVACFVAGNEACYVISVIAPRCFISGVWYLLDGRNVPAIEGDGVPATANVRMFKLRRKLKEVIEIPLRVVGNCGAVETLNYVSHGGVWHVMIQ